MSNTIAYHVCPQDQGQIVTVGWADAGSLGCIRRIYDASDRTESYTLHRWLVDGDDFAPWNGTIGCAKRGRSISASEAGRMMGAAQ